MSVRGPWRDDRQRLPWTVSVKTENTVVVKRFFHEEDATKFADAERRRLGATDVLHETATTNGTESP